MSEAPKFEGSMLVLWVDGRCCVAPLRKDRLDMLAKLLPVAQHEDPEGKPLTLSALTPGLTDQANELADALMRAALKIPPAVAATAPGPGQLKLERHTFEMRDLIGRAMKHIGRGKSRVRRPRWSLVSDAFCVGSTVATALCHEFNLDPDEDLRQ